MLNARFISQTSFGIRHWWYLVCSASKLPWEFPGTSKKDVGRGKNCKNAFKCNLKELTTKKAYSASGPQSVTMHLPSSSLHLSCNSWSMACGVSFLQHYPVIRFFFQLIDFSPKLLSLFFLHWYFSVWWVPACFTSFFCGISWLGCSIVVAMEALFKLGADRQKVKPLDTPGAQPPTGNAVVKCNNYFNVF